jgi:hypothetical protein
VDRAVEGELHAPAEHGAQEAGEFRRRHLARGFEKLGVCLLAETQDMAADRDIVRRIAEHQSGALIAQQRLVAHGIPGIAAVEPVRPDQPQVTRPADRLPRLRQLNRGLGLGATVADAEVEVAHLEAGDAQIVVLLEQELELGGKQLIIPLRQLRQPVRRDRIGAAIRLGDEALANDRHFLKTTRGGG